MRWSEFKELVEESIPIGDDPDIVYIDFNERPDEIEVTEMGLIVTDVT